MRALWPDRDDAHHRVDLRDGGEPYSSENLASLCRECHAKVGRERQMGLPDLLFRWRYGLDAASACLMVAASVGPMRAPITQSTGKKIPMPNSQ